MSTQKNHEAGPPPGRGLYCNRTLNMRSIKAIGYDLDYTLIHYQVQQWEQRAYQYLQDRLAAAGWPVSGLAFDPELVIRGLVIDTERGNLLKANRFGYVKHAFHGTRALTYDEQRRCYSRTIVDLSEPRYVFLNTLFSLSQAGMYAQLVDLLDAGRLPTALGYADLYRQVKDHADATHMEGELKGEIMARPDSFVELDEDTPLALLDQHHAGKKLLLITNSDWPYCCAVMSYAFDRYLPGDMTWRQLFDLTLVSARKPRFFSSGAPALQVIDDSGLLRPHQGALEPGGCYFGGNASLVEQQLGMSGDEILYVGDHIYSDVHPSKSVLRWRTALVVREMEDELAAIEQMRAEQGRLAELMADKEEIEWQHYQLRLALQRKRKGYGPGRAAATGTLIEQMNELRDRLLALDERIAPLAEAASQAHNPSWGLLMRAGNDKSQLVRQVERYADVYTSRVSNFLFATPFVYLRSHRGSLPHDP